MNDFHRLSISPIKSPLPLVDNDDDEEENDEAERELKENQKPKSIFGKNGLLLLPVQKPSTATTPAQRQKHEPKAKRKLFSSRKKADFESF